MQSELWDVYDSNKHKTGKTITRGTILPKDCYHIVVNILSMTYDGKILLTKRHPNKSYGGLWEITGGSVIAGERIVEGARRELFEETGLDVEECELYNLGSKRMTRRFVEFFLYIGDFSIDDITLQEGETVDAKIVSPNEIYKLYKENKFAEIVWIRLVEFFPEIFGKFPTFFHRSRFLSRKY